MSPGTDPVSVLVVEDNQRYAKLIEHMLGGDFAVDHAPTLGDAVEALQNKGGYSCILLDLRLPGTDRLDAVDGIRSRTISTRVTSIPRPFAVPSSTRWSANALSSRTTPSMTH